ncbi:MAG TPA: phosphoenolpyruvate--protein phosphotransferase [Stackebrandtia sp.]|jgi:phosphotransferase system enzyme I (PtsI)|uniref:phosphoenolpyruvate--protein phosphotransferase n=1 Tax=Stackebrandtia sp. TaxID=2023065 RepID=UPI002D2A003A|nr:phosphoenolpyruvate--protein phosphotransferase [Stackebrandtia sp.]HZE37961.1 phosphoenolpyruvate--protein phosphotransferase [Stackebrandtia sp.]
MPERLRGIGVSPGVAAGPLIKLAPVPPLPAPRAVGDVEAEGRRAREALENVAAQVNARAAAATGPAVEVLEAQAMMATDPMLVDAVAEHVGSGMDAAHAIHAAFAAHREAFAAAGGLLAERVTDLDDLRDRATAVCLDRPAPGVPDPGRPFVLAAEDLAPADTATLNLDQVLALVVSSGGPTSHTAILARAVGLPAIVGCKGITAVDDETLVSVDGATGDVAVGVDAAEVDRLAAQAAASRDSLGRGRTGAEASTRLDDQGTMSSRPGQTADGHRVALLSNIGGASEIPDDCEGVGLFRTELLYLNRTTAPTVAEQTRAYREVFAAAGDRPVVVRTLDAGADKPLPFANLTDEPNPALGVRGLRLVRRDATLMDTQLAAIAAAASDTDAEVRVMAPMVSTVTEAADFAERARAAGISTVGVMVEVPAAALAAIELVKVVDFLSIGTNDLSQYLFAADRQSSDLADLLDPWQPALLSLIACCADAGAAAGVSVGVCGEAASDPALAVVLAGLGVTSLSMSARALPRVRRSLSEHTMDDCRRAADQATRG